MHPPDSAARELPGSELCVHCGFCLQACPTYLALDDENESPRGRIVLMKAMADGTIDLTDAVAQLHLDRCLGCRACETACPSGVPYGQLLDITRERSVERGRLPLVARLVLFAFARSTLLSLAMAAARMLRAVHASALLAHLPGRAGFAMAMVESTRRTNPTKAYVPRGDASRGRTALLRGCVMDGLFGDANRATARTLAENDYQLVEASGQGCCGALHAHAGDAGTARRLARVNIAAFERSGAEWIAVNSAGCGSLMKDYGRLLRDDPQWRDRAAAFARRVRDVSELLEAAGPKRGAALGGRVAYDAPCHLQHAQRVVSAPLAVLAAIPGVEFVALTDADRCCGSAGIYNLVEPDVSDRVLAPKLADIEATGAPVVVTGNPGCLMQIGAGLARSGSVARTLHPVELLDASYARR